MCFVARLNAHGKFLNIKKNLSKHNAVHLIRIYISLLFILFAVIKEENAIMEDDDDDDYDEWRRCVPPASVYEVDKIDKLLEHGKQSMKYWCNQWK